MAVPFLVALAAGLLSQLLSLGTAGWVLLCIACVFLGVVVLLPWALRPRRRDRRIDLEVGRDSSFQTLMVWRGTDLIMALDSEPPERRERTEVQISSGEIK